VSGSIRIVQVGDMDCVACGGVHVDRTAQVRLVHAIAVESIRGNTRIAWKIGDRALAHYAQCTSIVSELSATLSAQPVEIPARVTAQEAQAKALELESRRLSRRIHELVARSLLAEAEPEEGQRTITAAFDDEPRDFLRGVAEELVRSTGVAVCLTNHADGRVQWTVGIAPGCAVSFDDLRDDLLPVIDAKGGGRPPIWQGVGTRAGAAQEFLALFRRLTAAARRA
jgi:alanyl-tRNA synthetase